MVYQSERVDMYLHNYRIIIVNNAIPAILILVILHHTYLELHVSS